MNVSRCAIGIDIGGTKMAAAVVCRNGEILSRDALPTEAGLGFERAVKRLIRMIEKLLGKGRCRAPATAGIGIGCAGPVDPARGHINNPFTLGGWNHCDIVSPLREHFHVPVFLENDADMAALGECFAGAGQGSDPVVMLTFGTGIGGAAVVNGQIYRGVHGEHPELGHVPVMRDGPKCYCGIKGCFESLASGTAIAGAGRPLGFKDARGVFAAADSGQAGANKIINRALLATERAAWGFLHTFLPQRFVLGGGICEDHYNRFAAAVNRSIEAATMIPRGKVSVVKAKLGNDAGLVGAAAMVFQLADCVESIKAAKRKRR